MDIKDVVSPRLLFNPNSPSLVEDVKRQIPEFAEYTGTFNLLSATKYIILMYDVNSTMWREVKDYIQRKRVCADMALFPRTKGAYSEEAEKILLGQDKEFNVLLVSYLRELAMPEYSQLVTFLQLQENHIREVLNFSADKNAHTAINSITETIISLTKKVFQSGDYDEVEEMKKALYVQLRDDIKKMRPENIAIQLRDEGNVPEEWSPYAGEVETEKKEVKERKKRGRPPKETYYNEDGTIDYTKQVMKFLSDGGKN